MEIQDNAGPAGDDPLLTEALAIEAAQQRQDDQGEQGQGQDDQSGDDPAAGDNEGQDEGGEQPPKRRPPVQERIDELTRARREAERDAEYWKSKALSAPAQPAPQQQDPAKEDAEPDPADYTNGEVDPAFIRDLARFETRQELAEQNRVSQARNAAQAVERDWAQRQDDFAKQNPDYFEALKADWPCTRAMADAIRTSDEGAAVAYHLAKNPDEARRLRDMNSLAQVREIGRLEAKLAAGRAPPEPTPTPKTISDAPGPTPQARGAGGKFKPSADTTDFAAFEQAYGG